MDKVGEGETAPRAREKAEGGGGGGRGGRGGRGGGPAMRTRRGRRGAGVGGDGRVAGPARADPDVGHRRRCVPRTIPPQTNIMSCLMAEIAKFTFRLGDLGN
jgi:hypothetical protein